MTADLQHNCADENAGPGLQPSSVMKLRTHTLDSARIDWLQASMPQAISEYERATRSQ